MAPRTIRCRCGKEITSNTFKTHLKGGWCSLESKEKDEIVTILNAKTRHPRAWLIIDGENATCRSDWFLSVINRETLYSDWTFSRPRDFGVVTPKKALEFSADRTGINNPMAKKHATRYDRQEIIDAMTSAWDIVVANPNMCFGEIRNIVEKRYPGFMYVFSGDVLVGTPKFTAILSQICGVPVDDIARLKLERRGARISAGLIKSPTARQKAARLAQKLCSTWRISFPQRVLFELVRHLDPDASMEYHIENKSYDVFSPKKQAVIEMHGDFWHSVSPRGDKMRALIDKNIANDEFKRLLAVSRGLSYHVFWHSKWTSWIMVLEALYGAKCNISIQDAENKVNTQLGTKRSLRH